ncbi:MULTISPECIES: ATP/GTP-binding protein [unclassified Streptomyces]|uniref:ATP/GTP-binding protein n=1 Tax=unclassified Streptomyces TaxID=2593676 RepID=UPI002DD951DA|nr:ATP/GTP-binding protein [Streptomyces sp. NBC_01795]WSA97747.1 ATP/GTP-binding protein [Streptomyces sp. NBC_01795]WSS46736.1 ATP/GTP-binding protein [Streptomyces sp. NBC_01187]WSS47047.1 ATP/GTP-binding protein [Streptomyces sp. NBC_01187]
MCKGSNPYNVAVCADKSGKGKSPGRVRGPTSNKSGGGGAKAGKPAPCQVEKIEQPPANSGVWEGHDPKKGDFYWRACNGKSTDAEAQAGMFFAEDPPGKVTVDPAQLARQAMDEMTLLGPEIVSPKAGGTYTVGVPLWLRAGAGETRWGPTTASASAGDVTVTATAKVSKVVWKMGDGKSVTCTTRGAAYKRGYGLAKSPDCGHTYATTSARAAKQRFTITATATWSVEWQVTGGGESGALDEVRDSQVTIPVGEGQVVGSN